MRSAQFLQHQDGFLGMAALLGNCCQVFDDALQAIDLLAQRYHLAELLRCLLAKTGPNSSNLASARWR
jgi:hypothetical protein